MVRHGCLPCARRPRSSRGRRGFGGGAPKILTGGLNGYPLFERVHGLLYNPLILFISKKTV